MKPRLLVIVGPTAAGKSELAVKLARRFNGQIISADSRQIYRGLEIGSGKILKREIRGIPHHLLGIADPRRPFTVVEFQRLARQKILDIAGRNKLPILVGGTGFWIDAVVFGLRLPPVPPNRTLRERLSKKSPKELLVILKHLDPERAKTVEKENPRRLIRAIEIAKVIGRTPKIVRRKPYHAFWIGIAPAKEKLEKAIKRRVTAMLSRGLPVRQAGLVREIKNLLKRGLTKKRIRELGFEYQASLEYLEGKIGRNALQAKLIRDSLGYARRQMAWFRRNKHIRWVNTAGEAERLTKQFLRP